MMLVPRLQGPGGVASGSALPRSIISFCKSTMGGCRRRCLGFLTVCSLGNAILEPFLFPSVLVASEEHVTSLLSGRCSAGSVAHHIRGGLWLVTRTHQVFLSVLSPQRSKAEHCHIMRWPLRIAA